MTDELHDLQATGAETPQVPASDRDEKTGGAGGPHPPAGRPERKGAPIQFSMGELFWIVTLAALALGVLALFPRPYAAGLAGLAVLASLLAIIVLQPTRPAVMIAWWVLFLVYLMLTLSSVLFPTTGL